MAARIRFMLRVGGEQCNDNHHGLTEWVGSRVFLPRLKSFLHLRDRKLRQFKVCMCVCACECFIFHERVAAAQSHGLGCRRAPSQCF